MRKFVYISGLAIVAMAACTKTEAPMGDPTESPIVFKPLAAKQTKSTPITKYENTTGDFTVYAWYQATATSTKFDPTKDVTPYMASVKCSYKNENVDGGTGEGAWFPEKTYYWPKNGKLTFSAYYPAETAKVTVDAKTGLTIKDYEIADATNQVDLMFSDRVYDRVNSTETDVNKDYDGVDIVFNHALSAVSFEVKTAADYGTDAIKLYSIEIQNANSKGTFNEGLRNGYTGTPAGHPAAWTSITDVKNYTVYSETAGQMVSSEKASAGKTCITMPQEFSDDIVVVIKYGIKIGDSATYLEQTQPFKLKGTKISGTTTDITAWQMGKWYKYTLTFTLDKVYFAPSVENWDKVTVADFDVK